MLDLLSPYVITTTRACAYTHTHTRTYVLACFFSGKKTQRANLWGRGNSTRANSYCCEGKTIERWKYIDEIESERQKSCQYCSFSSRRLCIKNYIVSYLPKLIKKISLNLPPLLLNEADSSQWKVLWAHSRFFEMLSRGTERGKSFLSIDLEFLRKRCCICLCMWARACIFEKWCKSTEDYVHFRFCYITLKRCCVFFWRNDFSRFQTNIFVCSIVLVILSSTSPFYL